MDNELTVVTFKWKDPNYRAQYTSEHVNILSRMVARHYPHPHRIVCYTDDPCGLDSAIEARPLWNDYASVPNPTRGGRPSCYRRLKLFSPAMQDELGERFVMMDLDCIIMGDLSSLWNRSDPIVFYRCPHPGEKWWYNGGMWLGSRDCAPQLWEDFDARRSPLEAAARGFRGSDQAWINYRMGPGLPTFGPEHGVRRITPYIQGRPLPRGTKLVMCFGDKAPWTLKHLRWVRENYC